MPKCVFCRFVAEQSRSEHTVFENKMVLVVLDDFPIADGHTLVILKEHQPDIASVSPEAAAILGQTVAHIAAAIKEALGAKLVYVAALGESVRHVHYHLIPRYERDMTGFGHFMSSRKKLCGGTEIIKRIHSKLVSPERQAFLKEFQEILKNVPPARKRGQRVSIKHFHDAMARLPIKK